MVNLEVRDNILVSVCGPFIVPAELTNHICSESGCLLAERRCPDSSHDEGFLWTQVMTAARSAAVTLIIIILLPNIQQKL